MPAGRLVLRTDPRRQRDRRLRGMPRATWTGNAPTSATAAGFVVAALEPPPAGGSSPVTSAW